MSENYSKIKTMCESINIPEGKLTVEYLFTIDAVDSFFYKNNIGAFDIKSGFTDGANDGGIDFVFSDTETLYLIQGKSSTNLSNDDVITLFEKMIRTISDFENKKYDAYSKSLKSAYLNAYDDLSDNKNIELVLFTKTVIDEKRKKYILENINNDFISEVTIIDHNDIENRKAALFQNSDLIVQDSISLYMNDNNKNNILSYGNDGIIVNIKASSLKKLFTKYENNGLFSYNLREHITQKSVDDGIDNTIKKEKENFWYYNNGITIGCEDYNKDGNQIKLYNFSIINGAQTTTKIGRSKVVNENNDKEDFAIVCKIIKAKSSLQKENDFIGKISEYSNSQKPIKARDLKSNDSVQRRLQMNCANNKYPLAVEIKRGVTPVNNKKVEKWQRVSNEYLGQLIYSCILQTPGTSRNSKNTIFSSQGLYRKLFCRKVDCNTLYDLVKLGYIYDTFADNIIKKENDLDVLAVVKNGKLTVLGVTIYLLKKQKGIVDSYYSENLHKDNLSGFLITNYPKDDLDEKLYDLFNFIIRQLKTLYETKKNSMKFTSYSNFFKGDTTYDEIILKCFDDLDRYDKEKLSSYMIIFLENDDC